MSPAGAAVAERRPRLRGLVLLGLLIVAAGCGPRLVTLPEDGGVPLPDFADIHAQATRACRGVRTLESELALVGHASQERLRARVRAGFERPDSMRLEVVGAFGGAAVLLVARGGTGSLLLTSDRRAVPDAPPEDILGALTGVSLAPADVLAVLTGCVVPMPEPSSGRLHENGWASIEVEGAVVFLAREGDDWRTRAARRDDWRIDYLEWQGLFPRVVRLQSLDQAREVELTATLSQISSNHEIPPAAFALDLPADVTEMTLDELRPLGAPE